MTVVFPNTLLKGCNSVMNVSACGTIPLCFWVHSYRTTMLGHIVLYKRSLMHLFPCDFGRLQFL